MAEYIYIAESPQYPGMVKIGRTDRDPNVRTEELSKENYGLPGNEVDAEWEAVKVIKVEDNDHAEAVLHEFYADQRVTDSRELFYTNDVDALADEAISVVNGVDIIQTFDSSDALFDALGIVSIATGLVITASIFSDHPNIKKAEKFMDDWEKRLEKKYSQSKSLTGKAYYGFLNWSFGISKIVGGMLPFMAKEMSEAIKVEIRNAEYKKEQEKKLKKQQKKLSFKKNNDEMTEEELTQYYETREKEDPHRDEDLSIIKDQESWSDIDEEDYQRVQEYKSNLHKKGIN